MIKAIIFDCFGVIITDSMQTVVSELSERDPVAAQKVKDIVHANNRGIMTPDESSPQIAKILGISPQAFERRIQQGEVKDHQLMDYIKRLRKDYKTALLSNVGQQSIQRRFTEQELNEHFDTVVISGEVGFMKPDAEIYHHAAKELGVEPNECIFIDDREMHCRGAVSTGMHAILYHDLPQLKAELTNKLNA